ncbi:DUF177 domain-containing protein [Verrucomicrobiota bacterium]
MSAPEQPQDRLNVKLVDIPPEGRRIRGELTASVLEIPDSQDLRVGGTIGYDLNVCLVSGELIVRGKLVSAGSFRCSRCLESFETEVRDGRFETAREVRDSPGDPGYVDAVDLTEDIREAILLCFPSFPVCRADCRGLCAQCGANLNESPCGCKPPSDGRWDSLAGLRVG